MNLLCNCPQVIFTGPHWWKVNIGSGNGLVPSGNKPLPETMLTQFSSYEILGLSWNGSWSRNSVVQTLHAWESGGLLPLCPQGQHDSTLMYTEWKGHFLIVYSFQTKWTSYHCFESKCTSCRWVSARLSVSNGDTRGPSEQYRDHHVSHRENFWAFARPRINLAWFSWF